MSSTSLTSEAITQLAIAIFAKRGARVMEASSVPDRPPREFNAPDELEAYIRSALNGAKAPVGLVVYYPDMGGRPLLERIDFDPPHLPGKTHRYTWSGWGLIQLQLSRGVGIQARLASTSLAQAGTLSETLPTLGSVEAWNWAAVERHAKRLQRVLKKVV